MRTLRHPYFICTGALLLALLATLIMVDRPVKSEREIARREAEGKKASLKHHVPVWLWRGLCVNVGLAAGLVALTPLAVRRLSLAEPGKIPSEEGKFSGPDWVMLGCATAIFLVHGLPRLSHSLWGDEENLVGTVIADQVIRGADGELTIRPTPWQETFWDYTRPTNHIGYSVVARVFHDTFFRGGSGLRDPFFSETLVRLPVVIAGVGWIFALAWCCRVWGWERGAGWVALALAGHGWMVRFGVDARGYGFVVLLVFLLLGFLGNALRTGEWRWWIGFGVAQFYLLWVHLGSVHAPVMLNLAALVMIALRFQGRDRLTAVTRWLVGNWISAMLLIALMSPVLVPFLGFLKKHVLPGTIDAAWLKDAGAYLACGTPWFPWASDNPLVVSVRDNGLVSAFTGGAVLGILGIGVALGVWRVSRSAHGALLIFLLGGPLLLMAHLIATETRPYHWYLIPFLTCVVLLWAAALHGIRSRWWRCGMGVLLVLSVHALAWKQVRMLKAHPIEAIRESVALTRHVTNPRSAEYDRGVLTACSIMNSGCYDPGAIRVNTAQELKELMSRADQERVSLYFNFGFRGLYREALPEMLALLDDRSLFEPVAVLPGLFVSTSREVVRYRGSSAR